MREDPHRQDPLAPAFTVRERRPTPARPTLDLLQPSQAQPKALQPADLPSLALIHDLRAAVVTHHHHRQ
ncbi:hypothetical protein SO802_024313 [Lithocarpus litseifolius]|uniref:Uncharacterized protein n=1 Tax=Lithocarpus litseifolius TaxID=425828 RepID=A0AAW2C8I4_9ROSI